MLRLTLNLLKLAVIVAVAVWLADRPGTVTIEWLGYRAEASVGLVLLALFLILVLVAGSYWFWRVLRRVPGDTGRGFKDRRQQRGLNALSQGLLAVAAGDSAEAQRWARRAEELLPDPGVTRLLSAQAAQLGGDSAAAEGYFRAMLADESTKFMGLRGLMLLAMERGAPTQALAHAKAAFEIKPKSDWVLTALFDLNHRLGQIASAEEAVKKAVRAKVISPELGKRRRAVLQTRMAEEALEQGEPGQARKAAIEALDLVPGFAPAVFALAASGEHGRALERAVLQAWRKQPLPDLLKLTGVESETALNRYRRIEKLTRAADQEQDTQGRIARAQAALDAELWGEARKNLEPLLDDPSQAVCRLMSQIEDAERADDIKARSWRDRGDRAAPDPQWVCTTCGALSDRWQDHCAVCQTFDSLDWRAPARVTPLPGVPGLGEVAHPKHPPARRRQGDELPAAGDLALMEAAERARSLT